MIVAALPFDLARALAETLPVDLYGAIDIRDVKGSGWWTLVPAGALVILDPIIFADDSVSLATTGAEFSAAGARVVFYTTFSSESMRAVAFAAALHPVELWITGIDDRASDFSRRVQRLAAHDLVAEVLTRILATADKLPTAIRAAVVALFSAPERFFEATDVARVAMTSRRNLDRYLVESGLGTARRLVVAARMVHGIARLGGVGGASRSARNVSDSLGYSDPEVFARQFAEVFGVRPAIRGTLSEARLVDAVVAYARSARALRFGSAGAEVGALSQVAV